MTRGLGLPQLNGTKAATVAVLAQLQRDLKLYPLVVEQSEMGPIEGDN